MSEVSNIQMNEIRQLLHSVYHSADHANDILCKNTFSPEDQLIASALINRSISYIAAATAIYYANYAELERFELEKLLSAFSEFEQGFMENLATEHSHQSTNSMFEKFKDLYVESSLSML